MSTAIVTGGTGFVGGAVVDRLLSLGWSVTMLVRDPARVHPRHRGHVVLLTGDLAANLPALPAANVLFHCAADMDFAAPQRTMQLTTVDGTVRLLESASAAKIGRFVHVSSQAVYGFDRHYTDADESTPLRPSPYAYCDTKRLAEEAVWAAAKQGLEVSVVRPGFVYGPGDIKSLPPVIKMLKSGQLKAHIDHGTFDTGCVHVENCAQGIVLAGIVPEAAGQAYHLGDGRVLTIQDLVSSLCVALAIKPPNGSMPFGLALALGTVIENVWRIFRLAGPPPMSAFLVAMLHRNSGFSIEKARRELAFTPTRQWEESLPEVIAWCEEVR